MSTNAGFHAEFAKRSFQLPCIPEKDGPQPGFIRRRNKFGFIIGKGDSPGGNIDTRHRGFEDPPVRLSHAELEREEEAVQGTKEGIGFSEMIDMKSICI